MRAANRFVARAVAAVMAAAISVPAPAAEADVALLKSFAGQYAGGGTLKGKDGPSSFECGLTARSESAGKLLFDGSCAVVLLVAGAMTYLPDKGRYEMVMTSNVGFTGMAFGRRDQDDLYFSMRDRDVNEENRTLTLTAKLAMRGDVILVSFDAVLDGEAFTGDLRMVK
jgi:hypothetical protein